MRTTLVRRLAALLLVPLALAAVAGPASAAGGAPPPALAAGSQAEAALAWLAAELDANGSRMPSSFDPSFTDWGLTADAVLALAAGGRGGGSSAAAATANLLTNATSYVTDADFGAGAERYAGALGKLLLVTLVQGEDPSSVDGLDLVAETRARMTVVGPQSGRFQDDSVFGDFSNGLGQAFAVLALARTTGGVPVEAVGYLLAQQCPAGGFRIVYGSGTSCTADSAADADATALAVDALLAVPSTEPVRSALAKAVAWLAGLQAADGSIPGGPSNAANANTTGLVAAALRAGGRGAAANRAAEWIGTLQLTAARVAGGPAVAEVGVLAYDTAARDAALASGIAAAGRDQFRRATSQASMALGLPSYGTIGSVVPVDPAPVAVASPGGAVTAGSTVTVTSGGFRPGEQVAATLRSDPVSLGSTAAGADGRVSFAFAVPGSIEAGAHSVELVGATSGVVVSVAIEVAAAVVLPPPAPTAELPAPAAQLPATGSGTVRLILLGLGLVAAGAVLVRRTRPVVASAPG